MLAKLAARRRFDDVDKNGCPRAWERPRKLRFELQMLLDVDYHSTKFCDDPCHGSAVAHPQLASGGCGCEGRVDELLQAAGDDVDGRVGEGNVEVVFWFEVSRIYIYNDIHMSLRDCISKMAL